MKNIEKNHIFGFLDTFLTKEQTIVVGVSGGPDSIMLSYILQQYYFYRGWDQSSICIAHFNHGQRKESKNELRVLKKYFQYNTFYRNTNIPKKGLGETLLRNLRHSFFEEVIKKSKSKHLFLGHNITDRIETTLLNIVRGCSIDGIISIKPTQKKKNYTIYRPLLPFSKNHIQKICDTHGLKYFIDKTNTKPITPRNILRNTIIPSLQLLHSGGEKNWYNSRQQLYNHLNNTINNKLEKNREKHTPHLFWGATKRYSLPIKDTTPHHLFVLFKNNYYATQKTIKVIDDFLVTGSGHLYIGGWYLFKIGEEIHCIDGSKDFWKVKHKKNMVITHSGKQEFNGYTFTATKDMIGYKVRYPQDGDIYKGKRLLKYMLNKKIPIFARNTTLVISGNDKIIAVLY